MATKTILVDMNRPILDRLLAVQGESSGRTLAVKLYAGSLPIDITGATVTLYATKPDNTQIFDNFTVTDGDAGEAYVALTSQFCAVAGTCSCEIRVTFSGGAVMKSKSFDVDVVAATDYTAAVESTSEYTALDTALGLVSGHEARITALESDMTTAEGNITALQTADADLSSTDSGKGASLVGINDAGSLITATTVEGALQELATPATLLNKIKLVDGAGSGLDADTLDGAHLASLLPLSGGTMTGDITLGDTRTIAGSSQTINDDAVYSFTPANQLGMLIIHGRSGTHSAYYAIVNFRTQSSGAYCALLTGSAQFAATTGVLTGTTGTDTKITVSAHTDGKIYIENRVGAQTLLGLNLLGN